MKINYEKLKIGDVLTRTNNFFNEYHHAIYIGTLHDGMHIVSENRHLVGVLVVPLDSFLMRGILKKVCYNDFNEEQQQEIFRRTKVKKKEIFNTLKYNSLDYVTEMTAGFDTTNRNITSKSIGIIRLFFIDLFLYKNKYIN